MEPISSDPKDSNYTSFRVINRSTGKPLGTFRAPDIVQMRSFMASFGHTGEGLFSKQAGANEIPVEATHGLWDVIHPSEDELVQRQDAFNEGNKKKEEAENEVITRPVDAPPNYTQTMEQLPLGFYFPTDGDSANDTPVVYPGQAIPIYDPSIPTSSLARPTRRPWHDTFRPPHGPPVFCPISIGYGAEVGLIEGQQALWDPIGKYYFFLDHIQKVTFFEDPRPPLPPKPVVQPHHITYGDRRREGNLPMALCRSYDIINHTSRRARSKPHGFVLNSAGIHGRHGSNGESGVTGAGGFPGIDGGGYGTGGSSGGPGGVGGPGTNAQRGEDATEASDVIITIYGNNETLNVAGTCEFTAQLGGDQCEEVLFVNCRGGDGGKGGEGGRGGRGGHGGRGGNGANGSPGHSNPGGPGGNGGPGGRGGDGGRGGAGGPGGRGGDGGHAGFGGACILQAQDPRLFILVEADCMCGAPGSKGSGGWGGKGGTGGSGGRGGHGGHGGSGGTYRTSDGYVQHYSNGCTGSSGFPGTSGCDGPAGPSGQNGVNGQAANIGGILWVVSSPDGGVLYESPTRYDCHVTGFHTASAVDDGIFEPNERVIITELTMTNDSSMNLPSGAIALIPPTKTIKFEPIRYTLPEIPRGSTYTVPISFYGRIFDQPPPNKPGPFVSKAEFIPRVELLGRPFERSFLKKTLVVQYPVKIAFMRCPENLGRGEVATIEIGIENISQMPYGSCPGSGGKVVLQVHFDQRLLPLAAANVGLSLVPYTVTYDPSIQDSLYVQIHEIPPKGTVVVQLAVQMEGRAELFDRCLWQADVYLRDKFIEYNHQMIRVSPFYTPTDPPADLLMITGSNISRREFVFWQKILESLNAKVDFWDIDRYNGVSVDTVTNARHEVTWEGRYSSRMILYPHADLAKLYGIDIARHFHGPNFREDSAIDLESSMLLFLPQSNPKGPRHSRHDDYGDQCVVRHLSLVDAPVELEENAYTGRHLFTPGTLFVSGTPYHSQEKKILKRMEKDEPHRSYAVMGRRVDIQQISFLRYKYGSVDIRHCPIHRSCKFLAVDGCGGSKVSMSQDDKFLDPNLAEYPLASHFGQVYLATLYCLPLKCKLELLQPLPEEAGQLASLNLIFHLPNGGSINKIELIVICISHEIADEVLNCSGETKRVEVVMETISNNIESFSSSSTEILRGMELIKRELKLRKKHLNNSQLKRACQQIERNCNQIITILSRASGVNPSGLPWLPRFTQLVDSDQFHFSHQYAVKENRFNLTGQ